jgi:hypothetical protein
MMAGRRRDRQHDQGDCAGIRVEPRSPLACALVAGSRDRSLCDPPLVLARTQVFASEAGARSPRASRGDRVIIVPSAESDLGRHLV